LKKGFVLLTVIVMLAFVGVLLFVIGKVASKITFQTNKAFLEAVEQNLISSGMAWAKHNNTKENVKTVELDASSIAPGNAQLSVTVENHSQVSITTACSRGVESLKHSKRYEVKK
jgi:hypothetical protein